MALASAPGPGISIGDERGQANLLYCTRLAEVSREALSATRSVLSYVLHVCWNVHQSHNRWIRARYRNYDSPSLCATRKEDASLSERPSRLLIFYEQFADPLLQASWAAVTVFRSSEGNDMFCERLR